MTKLTVTEGKKFSLERPAADYLRIAIDDLGRRIRPRFSLLSESRGEFTLQNVIGTVRLRDGLILEVIPKVQPESDWVWAIFDLLVGRDRIDIAGERRVGRLHRRPTLLDVLAAAYSARLQRALRRDGPILTVERKRDELGVLKGKLLTTQWVRSAYLRPHRFPVEFSVLDADNPFSRALALVARALASATVDPSVRGSLLEIAGALRPGAPQETSVDPGIVHRAPPPQWAVYQPAWAIAVAVLSRSSLLRSVGEQHGLEIAIEPWPLLERLLERSLAAAAESEESLSFRMKGSVTLLDHDSLPRAVVPDGRLLSHDVTLASFEAKYSMTSVDEAGWPPRDHIFQALTTAAACSARAAVLVYPHQLEPITWNVNGFDGKPAVLIALGLDMFSYRASVGEKERGERILAALESVA